MEELSQPPSSQPAPKRRWIVLIPLIAIGLIAPSACYYEEYGYGYYDHYPSATPYGYGGTQYYAPRRYYDNDHRHEHYSYSHTSEVRENNNERSEFLRDREKSNESRKRSYEHKEHREYKPKVEYKSKEYERPKVELEGRDKIRALRLGEDYVDWRKKRGE